MGNYIVTGASRGIGRSVVHAFTAQGHRVLACARSEVDLQSLAAETGCRYVLLDLANPDWDGLGQAVKAFGRIDGILHNAGALLNKPFSRLRSEELEALYKVNVLSAFGLFQTVMPHLAERAHVVAIGSVGGMNGSQKFPGLSGYSSSKSALSVLMECLQAEFESASDWTFNCLALGAVGTEMLKSAFPGYEAPMGPEDIAPFIVNFILSGNQCVRGKTLPISRSNP